MYHHKLAISLSCWQSNQAHECTKYLLLHSLNFRGGKGQFDFASAFGCFFQGIFCLDFRVLRQRGSTVYSAPPERMSTVCFQASLTKVFLTLFMFYILERFIELGVSHDLCQP
jgi:hypothetical protein